MSDQRKRIIYIDIMRAFAVIMMIQGHTVDTFLGEEYRTMDSGCYSSSRRYPPSSGLDREASAETKCGGETPYTDSLFSRKAGPSRHHTRKICSNHPAMAWAKRSARRPPASFGQDRCGAGGRCQHSF